MLELKPCPFCGGNGEKNDIQQTVVNDRDTGCWRCEIFMTESDWQNRPIEDALQSRIAELESERDTQCELIGKSAEAIYGEYHDMRQHVKALEAKIDANDLDEAEGAMQFAVSRIAELERKLAFYQVLSDPSSAKAFEAMKIFIQRYFNSEKQEQLIRYFTGSKYLEAEAKVTELEAKLAEAEKDARELIKIIDEHGTPIIRAHASTIMMVRDNVFQRKVKEF